MIPLNCWLVSRWLWLKGHMKPYWWTRRSLHFRGAVPHSGVAYHGPWKKVYVVEYVPPKKALGSSRNMLLLFNGSYRVWEFKAAKCTRFESLDKVTQFLAVKGVVE